VKILITGSQGQLGSSLARTFPHALALGRQSLDIADSVAVRDVIQSYRPQVIFNAAAYTAVDQAETEFDQAFRINGKALDVLGESAKSAMRSWSTGPLIMSTVHQAIKRASLIKRAMHRTQSIATAKVSLRVSKPWRQVEQRI